MGQVTANAALWRDRRFGLFWAAQTVSQFGDRISELALPLIAVVLLHADSWQVALLTAAIWTPNMLSMLVGAWVDARDRKRHLLVVADLVRAAALLSLPVAYLFDLVSIGHLYVVALLVGTGQVLFDVVYPAFFVTLVPRQSYVDANSKLNLSRSASFVAGPAAGGALIQALTAPVTVVVDALSFLFSAAVISRIRTQERAVSSADPGSLRGRIGAGLRLIARQPVLRASLACSATMNFFMFAAQALIILFAVRGLGLPSGIIGLALGIGAIGGVLGAVIAPAVTRALGLGRTILLGAVLYPAPVALLAAAHGPQWTNAALLGAMELLSGVGVMLFDIPNNALRTAVTPDRVRSRTAGAYTAVNYGSRPLGALLGGWLSSVIGLRPTLLTAAAAGAAGCLCLLFSPIPAIAGVPDPAQPSNNDKGAT